jgi:CAAX prenyl protease-like protein
MTRASSIRDDHAYIIPMAIFMLFTFLGSKWKEYYPLTYVAKTLIVAIALVVLWKHFTRIRWDHWMLGIVFGIIGIAQWVGMEKLLMSQSWLWWTRMMPNIVEEAFKPPEFFQNQTLMWGFIAVRLLGASLVVPVMEELFWRDFCWRTVIAPNDFKLAEVGEWDWKAFFGIPLIFACVHVQWLTAIVWALMIAWLLWKTKSLGACIIAHGVTNLLLGVYVLWTKEWFFW